MTKSIFRARTTARLGAANLVVGIAIFSMAVSPAWPKSGGSNIVTNCGGSGRGSLPNVVSNATAGEIVDIAVSCPATSPVVISGTIDISQSLSIDGPGPAAFVVSGNGSVGVFSVPSGVTATIFGLTIENGRAPVVGSYSEGGGIYSNGTLTVTNSTVSANTADFGGGIYSNGTLTVTDSTVTGNSAVNGWGGGIVNGVGGTNSVTDSTVADNSASLDGGGIYNSGTTIVSESTVSGNAASNDGGGVSNDGSATITNTTVADNSAVDSGGGGGIDNGGTLDIGASLVANSASGSDCAGVSGSFSDLGYNLDDDGSCGFTASTDLSATPAGLDPAGLESNGGLTQTIALEPGSAAIGVVNDASLCSTADQRGVVRSVPCDIGGYQTAPSTVVTNCSGSAVTRGSLPYEVLNADPGETITFALASDCSTITLAATIDIDTNLTIEGPGSSALAVSGNGSVGVFAVEAGWTTSIAGLTIEDGSVSAGAGIANNGGTMTLTACSLLDNQAIEGGGIFNLGTITVIDSTFSGNLADTGGGIDNQGTAFTVADSTFWNNSATDGGAVYNDEGTLAVTGSTLLSNHAAAGTAPEGAGIFNSKGTVSVAATILSDTGLVPGCDNSGSGTISDAGYNLDDDSCGFSAVNGSLSNVSSDLGTLENNGGPTETLAPALGSPVLNRIPLGATGNGVTLCPGADQRGVARPQGGACDIGAVELVLPVQAFTSPSSATAQVGSRFSFSVTTQGTPVPAMTKSGKMPERLTFVSNHNGTARISGTPAMAGTFDFIIKATFGKGKTRTAVSQDFTLTVDPA